MTTTTQNPTPTTSAAPSTTGFHTIPTRIRDLRDGPVPPLVVDPIADQDKQAICQSLGELAIKLAEIHRTACEAYLSQGAYEQALPHIEAAATFSPGEVEYQMQAGFVRYACGDDVGAINAFNKVLATDASNAEGWFNLGMVLFGQEQYGEAEDCFGRSLRIDATDAQTWNNRGVCLWKLGKSPEAKACFQKAIEIDPSDADAAFNLQSIG